LDSAGEVVALGTGETSLALGFVSGRIPEVKANYILIKNISIMGVKAGEVGRRDTVLGASNTAQSISLRQLGCSNRISMPNCRLTTHSMGCAGFKPGRLPANW